MTLDLLSLYPHIIKNCRRRRRRRRRSRKKKVHLLVLQSLESHVQNSRGSTQLSPQQIKLSYAPYNLSLSLSRSSFIFYRAYTHTHTHTHIYIYISPFFCDIYFFYVSWLNHHQQHCRPSDRIRLFCLQLIFRHFHDWFNCVKSSFLLFLWKK